MRFTFNIEFIEDKKKLKDKIVFLLFSLQRERERVKGRRIERESERQTHRERESERKKIEWKRRFLLQFFVKYHKLQSGKQGKIQKQIDIYKIYIKRNNFYIIDFNLIPLLRVS